MHLNYPGESDSLYWMNAVFAVWMTVTWIRILASLYLDLKESRAARPGVLGAPLVAVSSEPRDREHLRRAA